MTGKPMTDKPVAAENDKLITFENISKRFGNTHALNRVSFAVERGTVHALVGENGAGKSTLMNICSGALMPDSGTIRLDGKPARFDSPRAASAAGIAMIHQELTVLEHLTVAQNIMLGHEPRRLFSSVISYAEMHRAAAHCLERLQLDIAPTTPLAALQIGHRQLVEIAKALSMRARLLIMDEPTSALSNTEAEALFSVIATLKQEGITVLYISHRLEEIRQICDRVTVLRDGQQIDTAAVDQLDISAIVQMMVGEAIDTSKRRSPKWHRDMALETRDLSDDTHYHHVSLSLRRGEVFGLFGLLGAGRTELAQTIYGMRRAQTGSILVDGKKVQIDTVNQARKFGIAYLPEDRKRQGLFPNQSVRRNAIAGALARFTRLLWVRQRQITHIVNELTRRLSIKTASTGAPIAKLSGGNQQKVILARWLAVEPAILILDEPTRGIDVKSKAQIYELIDELAGEGIAILLISSELPEIFGVSDTIGVMRAGRLISTQNASSAIMDDIMQQAVSGTSRIDPHETPSHARASTSRSRR